MVRSSPAPGPQGSSPLPTVGLAGSALPSPTLQACGRQLAGGAQQLSGSPSAEGSLPAGGTAAAAVEQLQEAIEGSPTAHGGNIRVAVRVRPLPGDAGIIEVLGQGTIVIHKEAATGGNEYLSSQQGRCEERTFDRVFGPQASQEEVYAWSCQPLVQNAVEEGVNATIFVYGATGAGKTHTMFGEREEGQQGLIYRAIRDVFAAIGARPEDARPQTRMSFLELYNEKLYDLLQPAEGGGGNLCSLMEDERRGLLKIGNLSEVPVASVEDTLEHLQAGLQLRKVESTAMNQRSSRSHAVFMLQLEAPRRSQQCKICLIDLAGSERASQTQNVGSALRDGAKINQSLLALANCINALGESTRAAERRAAAAAEDSAEPGRESRERAKTPQRKPPYRDSKLTLLLKNSLVTGGLVSMIANVHPGKSHFEDSNNTLEYAKRTSSVKGAVVIRSAGSVPPAPRRLAPSGQAASDGSMVSPTPEGSGASSVAQQSTPSRARAEAPVTERVKWRQRSLTPSRRAQTQPQAETPKGERPRAARGLPPMEFTFATVTEQARGTANFGSGSSSASAMGGGGRTATIAEAVVEGAAGCSTPRQQHTGAADRSVSPGPSSRAAALRRGDGGGAETDGLRRHRSQPAAAAADAEGLRRQRSQPAAAKAAAAARGAPAGATGSGGGTAAASGAGGGKRLSDSQPPASPTPGRKQPPGSPPTAARQQQPQAVEPASPAPAAPRPGGGALSDASRDVLLQIVQSLQAEKAAMDARMRSERVAMQAQLDAALADRSRLELECSQLREANFEKDRQLAALLLSGQPPSTPTRAP